MARIRSDKPEAYQSETLAEISIAAERTFKGMATISDDRGRLTDKPAQINGELWSMRGNHTRDDLEGELAEMIAVGLVCRYAGCDGKRYLHMVSWDQHQKIDRPSKSRLPRCPLHLSDLDYCGLHEGACDPRECASSPREDSRDLQQVQTRHDGDAGALATPAAGLLPGNAPRDAGSNGAPPSEQEKRKPSRQSREGSMQDLGSRTVDLGPRTEKTASPNGAAAAPPPDEPAGVTAQTLVAEWLDHCRKRPPDRVIGQVAKELAALLAESHDVADIRAGLVRWHGSGKHPSTLASFVNEVMNASPGNGQQSPRARQQTPADNRREWMANRS